MKNLLMILAVFAVVLGSSRFMTTKAFANDGGGSAVVLTTDGDPNEPVVDPNEPVADANAVAE